MGIAWTPRLIGEAGQSGVLSAGGTAEAMDISLACGQERKHGKRATLGIYLARSRPANRNGHPNNSNRGYFPVLYLARSPPISQ